MGIQISHGMSYVSNGAGGSWGFGPQIRFTHGDGPHVAPAHERIVRSSSGDVARGRAPGAAVALAVLGVAATAAIVGHQLLGSDQDPGTGTVSTVEDHHGSGGTFPGGVNQQDW